MISRRALVCLAMLAVIVPAAAGCSPSPALASAKTVLHITYWPHGHDAGHARSWRLTCHPTGGTHPAARLACHELDRHAAELGPPSRPCMAAAVRGAAAAEVRGHVGRHRVDRAFHEGCDQAFADLSRLLTSAPPRRG